MHFKERKISLIGLLMHGSQKVCSNEHFKEIGEQNRNLQQMQAANIKTSRPRRGPPRLAQAKFPLQNQIQQPRSSHFLP